MTVNNIESNPTPENAEKKVLEFALRHVVSFSGAYVSAKKDGVSAEVAFTYSGFLATIHNEWLFVTAGHILKELDEALEKKAIKFTARVLVDSYGPDAKHRDPIPFDYEAHKRMHVDEDGLDFAFILLHELEVKALLANGIEPFKLDGKPERPWAEYDLFAVVGFPEENVKSDLETKTGPVTLHVQPVLSPVELLDDPALGDEPTKYPRFIGRLLDPEAPKSVLGMSGGAIIGMKRTEQGILYWVVAIQSSWKADDRTIFGCPISVILGVIGVKINKSQPD